jgi:transketolase
MATDIEQETVTRLEAQANALRQMVIDLCWVGQCGHPGGSLSLAEIMACLYFDVLRIDPQRPRWEDRDRLILSKGHAAPVYYSALAARGFFSPDWLSTYGRLNTILQGHPDMSTPGVDMSSGSLGLGLSPALGMALAAKLQKKDYRVYVIIGDGESQEGQIWEAAMVAPRFKLDNVTVIVDKNNLQLVAPTDDAIPIEPFAAKWQAFNWHAIEVDGHSVPQLLAALDEAKATVGRPTVIVAHTVKGKGVSFMENNVGWHSRVPNSTEYEAAVKELRLACKGDL